MQIGLHLAIMVSEHRQDFYMRIYRQKYSPDGNFDYFGNSVFIVLLKISF